VAVTTRDLHPLPYSLAALFSLNGGKHLKVLAKNRVENCLETKAKTTTRPKRQSIAPGQTTEFILREARDGCR
jgi:hypothetical protein